MGPASTTVVDIDGSSDVLRTFAMAAGATWTAPTGECLSLVSALKPEELIELQAPGVRRP